ncbi:hypothetical protein [Luteimonas aestuarii]|uniref:hypothetical protein n=1 Tax=Luteimonas aestuarii TaxID=453837 RepID=UPI00105A7CF4|nr:hypothetical protein [Luteimonas aestuarii]
MALTIASALVAAQVPDVCTGLASDIAPDMRILESDLDKPAASRAAAWLGERIERGELDGEFEYGVANGLKVIHGHALRQQALAERSRHGAESPEGRSASAAFCRWLAQDGFWYD